MGSQSQSNLHNNNNNNNSMIALLFCSLIVAAAADSSCQKPARNAMCHSSDPALPHTVTFAPCCDGSECLPRHESDPDARFCQIPEGGDCSVSLWLFLARLYNLFLFRL